MEIPDGENDLNVLMIAAILVANLAFWESIGVVVISALFSCIWEVAAINALFGGAITSLITIVIALMRGYTIKLF